MLEVTHRSYTVTQASNHHIIIKKDGHKVMHAQCNAPKSIKELKSIVDTYIELTKPTTT